MIARCYMRTMFALAAIVLVVGVAGSWLLLRTPSCPVMQLNTLSVDRIEADGKVVYRCKKEAA